MVQKVKGEHVIDKWLVMYKVLCTCLNFDLHRRREFVPCFSSSLLLCMHVHFVHSVHDLNEAKFIVHVLCSMVKVENWLP